MPLTWGFAVYGKILLIYVCTREALAPYITQSSFDVASYTTVKETTQYVEGPTLVRAPTKQY